MVTDEQVRLLRQKRMDGKSQEAAAAAAGMSVRTARAWERGPLPSRTKKERSWRTRKDPFEEVWALEIEPLLRRDEDRVLQGTTILDLLEQRDHSVTQIARKCAAPTLLGRVRSNKGNRQLIVTLMPLLVSLQTLHRSPLLCWRHSAPGNRCPDYAAAQDRCKGQPSRGAKALDPEQLGADRLLHLRRGGDPGVGGGHLRSGSAGGKIASRSGLMTMACGSEGTPGTSAALLPPRRSDRRSRRQPILSGARR
jgi:hypothetical protein